MNPWRQDVDGRLLIPIKAVPAAASDDIAGPLGDRVKIRVSAAAEAGKANRAICRLLARELGIKKRDVEIVSGQMSPEKLVAARGVEESEARRRLGLTD